MTAPLEKMDVTCPYGWRTHPITGETQYHNGVDLRAAEDTPIRAPFDGVVAMNSHATGGKQLILTHPGGLRVGFAHLSRYAKGLGPGDHVKEGQVVAYSGSTGRVTGPHVHYTTSVVTNKQKKFFNPALIRYSLI